MTAPNSFPLSGLRVVDLSRALSGPYVGRILSDLGAEVVKVEWPGQDIAHAFGEGRLPHSGLYAQLNAGKANVGLDLSTETGRAAAKRLCCVADVVIENFRPGVLEHIGLGWSVLSSANPSLVLLSISGFGSDGPEAGRRAYAPVAHAEAGLLGRMHQFGHRLADIPLALADSLAALHGVIGVLSALSLRDRHGIGQHVDVTMLQSVLATDDYIHYSLDKNFPLWSAAGQVFDRPDGPILVAADERKMWKALTLRHGVTDPKPAAPPQERFAARREQVEAWIASFDERSDLTDALAQAGIAWADVRTPEDVLMSRTAQHRGVSVDVDDRAGGLRPVVKMPYTFSDGASGPRSGAAFIGEHTAEVLKAWAKMADGEIAALVTDGTVCQPGK